MDPEDLNVLYDRQYAAADDDRFLLRDVFRSDAAFEVAVLAEALTKADSWLDVACGTDISPAGSPAAGGPARISPPRCWNRHGR